MTSIKNENSSLTRRGFVGALASLAAITAAPIYANAPGILRGAGDIRTVRMSSQRTGESLNSIYWVDGEYIPEVLSEVNFLMRDWRQDEIITMNPNLLDVMSAVHRLLDVDEPYLLLSGYRSPTTNAMLRQGNGGVARNSYHTRGMAADLRLSSRSVYEMYNAAVACHGGGVGRYNRSNFVHFDCGPIRTWRR